MGGVGFEVGVKVRVGLGLGLGLGAGAGVCVGVGGKIANNATAAGNRALYHEPFPRLLLFRYLPPVLSATFPSATSCRKKRANESLPS